MRSKYISLSTKEMERAPKPKSVKCIAPLLLYFYFLPDANNKIGEFPNN